MQVKSRVTAVTLRPDEQLVIAAVSRAFSAPSRPGENPPDAYICLDGDDIPVETSTLMHLVTDTDGTRAVVKDNLETGALGLNRMLEFGRPKSVRIA
jgi:hypothetical protein